MKSVGTYMVENGVGIILIDSPPVNALGKAARQAVVQGLQQHIADDTVKAVVLACAGKTFFAGADINEFGKPAEEPSFPTMIALLDASPKPVVAAIYGTALGGGFETALACHYRIAVPSAAVGLPEVKLGLLPGAGGTQRVPRVVGVERALEIMTSGRMILAKEAQELGLIDAIVNEGNLMTEAIAFASRIVAVSQPLKRVRDRDDKLGEARGKPELFDAFMAKNARAFRGYKAQQNIIKAVQAAVDTPNFEAGLAREGELFSELLVSTESAAQRHAFFAEREAAKIPDVPPEATNISIKSVGVIGAGTMGGGIAMNFINAGIPVTLVEMNQEALDRGTSVIRKNYEASAAKGRMTTDQVAERMNLITPALGLAALSDVDLVIEAVFEEMGVKKDIFGKLDTICKQGTILATNTSFLDINEIAASTRRPEWVCGLHFFSPANVMPLLEVVRGAKTSNEIVATAMKVAKVIGKKPVLSRVGHGFIANRVMEPYMKQAMALILAGPTPQEVDQAMFDYGFAMGPLAMLDLVGLDVMGRESGERSIMSKLFGVERLGQKKNGGFYDYDEKRRPVPSPEAMKTIADFAEDTGVRAIEAQTPEQIVARLLYPVVNEGAKVLEEGIAIRASDVDLACMLGYNWPVYTGGPMFWANTVGLGKIVDQLDAWHAELGDTFQPSAHLRSMASQGKRFTKE